MHKSYIFSCFGSMDDDESSSSALSGLTVVVCGGEVIEELTETVVELTEAVVELTKAVVELTEAVAELTEAVVELTEALIGFGHGPSVAPCLIKSITFVVGTCCVFRETHIVSMLASVVFFLCGADEEAP